MDIETIPNTLLKGLVHVPLGVDISAVDSLKFHN